jgi:acetylornithine aminotransferase
VAVTDNPVISAPINKGMEVMFLPLNDLNLLEEQLKHNNVSSLIVEGIQGVGGINIPEYGFLQSASKLCEKYDVVFILDEIQSGYGRSGKFFAHQYAGIRPDMITTAKGMGNGFPIGGVLISPKFAPKHGMLGTTFGGNYLACAAGLAVLQILQSENLIDNAAIVGQYIMQKLSRIDKIKAVRGQGLMIGIEFDFPIAGLRKELLFKHKIFTGITGTNVIRLLSPLCLSKEQADLFLVALAQEMSN